MNLRTYIFTSILFLYQLGYGQKRFEDTLLNKIEFGYSTRWDIENIFGHGLYITGSIMDPYDEDEKESKAYRHSNGILYANKGLLFSCASDSELIKNIYFIEPYEGIFNGKRIVVGKTLLKDIFPRIDTFKVTTTGASPYWDFQFGDFTFFLEKPEKDKNKAYYSIIPPFDRTLDYYLNRPIKKIVFNGFTYDKVGIDFKRISFPDSNDNHLFIDIYAPKNETHFNCKRDFYLKPYFPVHWLVYGEGAPPQRKQGYWKVYYPNHKLKFEGEFKDDKEVGIFKYYDIEGNLVDTKKYYSIPWFWLAMGLIPVAFIIMIIRFKRK